MKKKKIVKLVFYILFVIIVIAITEKYKRRNDIKITEQVDNKKVYEPYDYKEYSKIKLYHTKENTIEEMDLDTYLLGVVASEMPATFEEEALKAQAVVARTYTIYQISNSRDQKHAEADICDNSQCCQAWISKENRYARWEKEKQEEYWKKIEKAVYETQGKMIYYDNKVINALFHSNSGGMTELSSNVWGGELPYFQVIETKGEDMYSEFSSRVEVTKEEFISKLKEKYSKFSFDFSKKEQIQVIELTDSGRIKKIKLGNAEFSGIDIRKLFGLKSSKFSIEIKDNKVIFNCQGYGHGVGLSQCGSDVLAKNGNNYEDIIKYYYKDVEIK